MHQLRYIWRTHSWCSISTPLQMQSRCVHVCSSLQWPRQARWLKPIMESEPDADLLEDTVAKESVAETVRKTNVNTQAPTKKINPVVLKCQEILASLPLVKRGDEDDVEYSYKTKFGSVRFDKDNMPTSNDHLEKSTTSEKSGLDHSLTQSSSQYKPDQHLLNDEVDRQYFGAALDKNYEGNFTEANDLTTDPKVSAIQDFSTDQQFIDRQFFGDALDRNISKELNQPQNIDPSFIHSREDLQNDKDLNYIDELFFKDPGTSSVSEKGSSDVDNDALENISDETNKSEILPARYKLKDLSDFERALLDVDDDSPVYHRDPRLELTPRVKKLEQDILSTFKEQSATTKKGQKAAKMSLEKSEETIDHDFQSKTLKSEKPISRENIELSDSKTSVDNTAVASSTRQKLFYCGEPTRNKEINKTLNEDSNEVKTETAMDYVTELRRKKKTETLQEKDKDGGMFVPRYKTIISSVWDQGYQTRAEMKMNFQNWIIYDDNDIVAMYKPYGMRIHGGADPGGRHKGNLTLMDYIPELCDVLGADELHHIHRLDVNTTGVLLLARTVDAASKLRRMFKQHNLIKTYLAITKSVPSVTTGLIDIPLKEHIIDNKRRMGLRPIIEELNQRNHGGVKAVTKYKVLSCSNSAALLSAQPLTGVKHQIRAHLGLGLGCPIIADHKYSSNSKLVPQKLSTDLLDRLQIKQSRVRDLPLMLHASSIFLPQFANGVNVKISCPPPPHFSRAMKILKLNSRRNVTNQSSLDHVDLGVDLV